MKFTRRHTEPGISPYHGAELVVVPLISEIVAASPHDKFSDPHDGNLNKTVAFPARWSVQARNVFLMHCLVRDSIALDLQKVSECDVPSWLWRSEPTKGAKDCRSEESLTEAIDRICGAWTYLGWKGGYFDTEEDALTYFDECRWLLFHQKISPSITHWQFGGRYWAYGHDVAIPSTYLTDYKTGIVRRAEKTDLPPQGAVINAANCTFAGDGGVMDLWRREADILSRGGNCGVNAGEVLDSASSEAAIGMEGLLDIGDDMAHVACARRHTRMSKRRLTVDASHPASNRVARRNLEKQAKTESAAAGTALTERHVQAIIDACAPPEYKSCQQRNAPPGATLMFALQSARQALLPEGLIERTLYLARKGMVTTAADLLGAKVDEAEARKIPAITVIRLDEGIPSTDCDHDELMDCTAIAAWTGIESGLHFAAATDAWNTCPASGAIRSASGDGGYLFHDDTAADSWFINASAFQPTRQRFDIGSYVHAVELLAVAADISLMATATVSPRLAHRIWNFRPLALSVIGIPSSLMRAGLAYDSAGGRAFCAGIASLLSGTAYLTSARMAEELGAFPEFPTNQEDMLRILGRHSDTAAACAHPLSPPDMVEAVENTWSEAVQLGSRSGFRNAQVSAHCSDSRLAGLLDTASAGPGPLDRLTTQEQSSAGYWTTRIDPAVPQGLRALGYSEEQIDAIVRHVVGHGTLAKAPGVNHETLRKRGFTQAAIDTIEQALASTTDITLAFDPFVLGEEYCRHMLGFGDTELYDESFDMLAALGFSDAGIEAANIFCYGAGTMEGAPYISPDHVEVFRCAEPRGPRGTGFIPAAAVIRMMAAIQPHISGGIGYTLQLATDSSLEDCREYLELGRRLDLKTLTLVRSKSVLARANPATAETTWQGSALPSIAVIEGGQPANNRVSRAANAEFKNPETASSGNTDIGTDVADSVKESADVSRASRRAFSHAARSTTSVSSSADVASSNGMFDVASP